MSDISLRFKRSYDFECLDGYFSVWKYFKCGFISFL